MRGTRCAIERRKPRSAWSPMKISTPSSASDLQCGLMSTPQMRACGPKYLRHSCSEPPWLTPNSTMCHVAAAIARHVLVVDAEVVRPFLHQATLVLVEQSLEVVRSGVGAAALDMAASAVAMRGLSGTAAALSRARVRATLRRPGAVRDRSSACARRRRRSGPSRRGPSLSLALLQHAVVARRLHLQRCRAAFRRARPTASGRRSRRCPTGWTSAPGPSSCGCGPAQGGAALRRDALHHPGVQRREAQRIELAQRAADGEQAQPDAVEPLAQRLQVHLPRRGRRRAEPLALLQVAQQVGGDHRALAVRDDHDARRSPGAARGRAARRSARR